MGCRGSSQGAGCGGTEVNDGSYKIYSQDMLGRVYLSSRRLWNNFLYSKDYKRLSRYCLEDSSKLHRGSVRVALNALKS